MNYCDNLKTFDITNSGTTSLQVTLYESGIKTIDITDNTSVQYIDARNCPKLESVNTSGCTDLYRLQANNSNISNLDLTNCTALYELNIQNNKLTDLDLTGLTSLNNVNSQNNLLETIDVTSLTNLRNIYADNNKLPLSQSVPADGLPGLTTGTFIYLI